MVVGTVWIVKGKGKRGTGAKSGAGDSVGLVCSVPADDSQLAVIEDANASQQKGDSVINQFIEELKSRAKIERNEKWLAAMRAKRPADPLDTALKSGKPTVLDLGAGTCVPCKMMKPIFAELQDEMGDRINFLILEISEYRHLASRYNVRLIPTQIFFDKDGKVFWRHEGFLSKEDIKKKLNEIGVE